MTYQNISNFYEASSRILNSQRSSALNFLSPILPHFVFKPLFFQLCWIHFLKIMWKRIFDDLFQPMHQKKKKLFQSSDWGVKGRKNNLLFQNGRGWIFNSTNSVVPCWSLTLSIRKKGCSVVHQLLHHIPKCRALAGVHGVCQGKMCKRWRVTASPGGKGTHPCWREAVRNGFAWGLPPSQVMSSKTSLLVTLFLPLWQGLRNSSPVALLLSLSVLLNQNFVVKKMVSGEIPTQHFLQDLT